MTDVVIFDTEYTTWENSKDCDWGEPWMEKEVVQIAAIKINLEKLEILEEFECLVKPVINPVLSDCFIRLTGIDNEQVEKGGVSFKEAYERFSNFAGDLECWSYNPRADKPIADGHVMKENLVLNNLPEEPTLKYVNIHSYFKENFAKIGVDILKEKINSGKIAKKLGLDQHIKDLGHDEHNALYDVLSMYEGFKYFKNI
ncbi:MAG: exonuclease domain-containing protein [Alphaproteobacteria bacterium]